MKRLFIVLPLIFIASIAYAGTPIYSTKVDRALTDTLDVTGKWNSIQFADGTTQTTAGGGAASFTTTTGSVSVSQLPGNSITTVTYTSGTITINCANVATLQMFKLTLGGTATINFSGAGTGSVLSLWLLQDGTGTRTVQWATATVFFPGGTKPVLTATPNAKDRVLFECLDGVGYYNTGFSPDVK